MYISEQKESVIIKRYHDELGHKALNKIYDSMSMYKMIHTPIDHIVECQSRSTKNSRPRSKYTEISPYLIAKIELDISGSYPTSSVGHKCIEAFVDIY